MCCFLVTACLYVRDLERAAQWSRYAIDMSGGRISGPWFDYPRTEYAVVLTWWGRWEEAERELLELFQDAAARPVPAALARLRLADLRRRQGRFDEAQELLDELDAAPHRAGLGQLTVLARAALELDRDDAEEAAALAERYLRSVPPHDLVERVDALAWILEVDPFSKNAWSDGVAGRQQRWYAEGVACCLPDDRAAFAERYG